MGCWDCMCAICGAPPGNNSDGKQFSNWLNKCTVLTSDGKVYHNMKEVYCNVTFSNGKIEINCASWQKNIIENKPIGIFLHTACWKYAKELLKIKLRYYHLPSHKMEESHMGFKNINYGIESFVDQQFRFDKICKKTEYLISSPLKNKKNATRIKGILSKLKLTKSNVKKNMDRPSPFLSATFCLNGDCKIGNDKKIYIKKGGRWTLCKNQLKKK